MNTTPRWTADENECETKTEAKVWNQWMKMNGGQTWSREKLFLQVTETQCLRSTSSQHNSYLSDT